MRRLPSWLAGAAGALAFLALYFGAWQPVRVWLAQSVASPALASVHTDRSGRFTLDAGRHPRSVYVLDANDPAGEARAVFHAPAGRAFLIAALALIALFPFRPYWLYLWGLHLALGALSFVALLAGIGWTDAGLVLHTFLDRYVTLAVSMAAPLVAWPGFRRRIGRGGEGRGGEGRGEQ